MVESVLPAALLNNVSFADLLRMEDAFNSHPESAKRNSYYRKTSQEHLYKQLHKLFPEEGNSMFWHIFNFFIEIIEEYKHPKIISNKGHNLELDFYFPRLNLAFEYQVMYHFPFVNLLGRTTL
jgi:hypothetical protein